MKSSELEELISFRLIELCQIFNKTRDSQVKNQHESTAVNNRSRLEFIQRLIELNSDMLKWLENTPETRFPLSFTLGANK